MSWNCIYGGCRRGVSYGSMLHCWNHRSVREYWPVEEEPPAPRRTIVSEPTGSPEYEALKAKNLAEIREKRG